MNADRDSVGEAPAGATETFALPFSALRIRLELRTGFASLHLGAFGKSPNTTVGAIWTPLPQPSPPAPPIRWARVASPARQFRGAARGGLAHCKELTEPLP